MVFPERIDINFVFHQQPSQKNLAMFWLIVCLPLCAALHYGAVLEHNMFTNDPLAPDALAFGWLNEDRLVETGWAGTATAAESRTFTLTA